MLHEPLSYQDDQMINLNEPRFNLFAAIIDSGAAIYVPLDAAASYFEDSKIPNRLKLIWQSISLKLTLSQQKR